MKPFFSLLTVLLFTACSLTEKPDFIEVKNFYTENIDLNQVTITADAIFYNPNDIGYEVVDTDIDVFVNGNSIGKAKQKESISIQRKGNFALPIVVSFAPKDIIKDSKDLFGAILNNILLKKIDMTFKGQIRLKKVGIPLSIPIEYNHIVEL